MCCSAQREQGLVSWKADEASLQVYLQNARIKCRHLTRKTWNGHGDTWGHQAHWGNSHPPVRSVPHCFFTNQRSQVPQPATAFASFWSFPRSMDDLLIFQTILTWISDHVIYLQRRMFWIYRGVQGFNQNVKVDFLHHAIHTSETADRNCYSEAHSFYRTARTIRTEAGIQCQFLCFWKKRKKKHIDGVCSSSVGISDVLSVFFILFLFPQLLERTGMWHDIDACENDNETF